MYSIGGAGDYLDLDVFACLQPPDSITADGRH
jgi:hypothetical protein